jgi:HCOMODA/2-hydroxy-3-carboxy-muconic semialdehyde decarboxylase
MNARLQAQAMALGGPVTYLSPGEAKQAEAVVGGTLGRPWELWKQRVRRNP